MRFAAGLTIGIWGVLALAPLLLGEWQLGQLSQLMSYGIFAMSLAFIWGQAGLLCFGQAIFFGIGAYSMSVITKGMLPLLPANSALGLIAASLLAALVAWLAAELMFRGRGLSGAYFAIVTLAAAVIAERLASHWSFVGGFNGLLDVPPLRIANADLLDTVAVYYVMLGAAAAVYLLLLALERCAFGTVLRAIRDGEARTWYFGLNVNAYKIASFTLAGAVAGLAGGLFVTQFGFASPALIGVALSTEVLIWTALGGREVLLAAFLGALAVRSIEGALSQKLGAYWLLALGALFVGAVVIFPHGLLGRALRLPLPRRLLCNAPAKTNR